jgi:hypothetical protein
MAIERADSENLRVLKDGTLIAEAVRTTLALDVPTPPEFNAALAARGDSPSFETRVNPLIPDGTGFHPVCACCGADAPADEGLHVYAAPVAGFDGVAAAWRPHAGLAGVDGFLPESIVWTALDCPVSSRGSRAAFVPDCSAAWWRARYGSARGDRNRGDRLASRQRGRKHFAGTALFDADGELCAFARQTWIGRMD